MRWHLGGLWGRSMEPYTNATLLEDGYFAHPSSFMETVRVQEPVLKRAGGEAASVILLRVLIVAHAISCARRGAVRGAVCADGDVHCAVRHGSAVTICRAAVVLPGLRRHGRALASLLRVLGVQRRDGVWNDSMGHSRGGSAGVLAQRPATACPRYVGVLPHGRRRAVQVCSRCARWWQTRTGDHR